MASNPVVNSVDCIQVITVYDDGEQAVEERLQTLVACSDDFVKHLENKQ